MAVVEYKTNLYKPRVGVCSTWLASIDQEERMKNVKIPVWIKKATISFPKSLEAPVIMIGPGEDVHFVLINNQLSQEKCYMIHARTCVSMV